MKAWLVKEKDEFSATVVFAENRNKAKQIAMSTDACDGVEYINIEARRLLIADSQYIEGKTEMDWNDPDDRLFLIKECGFYCAYDNRDNCDECLGKHYCKMCQDELEALEQERKFNCEECYRNLQCWACKNADLEHDRGCGKTRTRIQIAKEKCFVCDWENCGYRSKENDNDK